MKRFLSSGATIAAPAARSPSSGPLVITQFYHTETFGSFIENGAAEIERRLFQVPLECRLQHLAPGFEGQGRVGGEDTWKALRAYLDQVEAKMAACIGDHSPAYWLHLYRRIAPTLADGHDSKTDANTVTLVRQIAELAYLKHGDVEKEGDLGPVAKTRLETFLGGRYYDAVSERLGSKLRAREQYQRLRNSPQSVMLEFNGDEIYRAFEVEGLAYEYWRTSATMRSVGKGSTIEWDEHENWFSYDDDESLHPLLFALYDARIQSAGGLHTTLGTWMELGGQAGRKDRLFFTAYNPHPKPEQYPVWDPVDHEIAYGWGALNFHIGSFSLSRLKAAHAFMAQAFEARHKVKLEAVFLAVWATSFFAFFPDRLFLETDSDRMKSLLLNNLTNLHQRGYAITRWRMENVAEEALVWARAAGQETTLTIAEVNAAFEFVCLDRTGQGMIALWSGGKRPLMFSQDGRLVADVAAIAPFLQSLFFGVREDTGAKGPVFEAGVRDALGRVGLEIVYSGEVEFPDGAQREIDAAVRLGDRLVLIECFSFERPLDFELARPGVLAARQKRLLAKAAQARSLHDAILARPSGKNFDFSWATSVEWRLASPFVEFAWDFSDDCFDQQGVARLMQVDELLDYLKDNIRPGGVLADAVGGMVSA